MTTLTHHPDCQFWHGTECTCGLTAPAVGKLQPWSEAAMEEWRKAVRAHQASKEMNQ